MLRNKKIIAFISSLLILTVFAIIFVGRADEKDGADLSAKQDQKKQQSKTDAEKIRWHKLNVAKNNSKSAGKSVSRSAPEIQIRLNSLLDETFNSIEECRKKLREKLPSGIFDGDIDSDFYKDSTRAFNSLKEYYLLMNEKRDNLNKLETFFDDHIERDIDYSKMSKKLKDRPFKDCGDFEEHSIISLVMEAADDYDWDNSKKKKLSGYILTEYKKQLQTRQNTMSLAIKIGIIDEFVEEGFMPSKYADEVGELIREIRQSRMDIMNSLPTDFKDTKVLSREDFLVIREKERDESDKNARKLLEFIERYQNEL